MTVEWISLGISAISVGIALNANRISKEANRHAVEKDKRESVRLEATMRAAQHGQINLEIRNAGTIKVFVHRVTLNHIRASWTEDFLRPGVDPGATLDLRVWEDEAPWAMKAGLTVLWSRQLSGQRESRMVAVTRPES